MSSAEIVPSFGFAEPVASLTHYVAGGVALVAAPGLLRSAGPCAMRRTVLLVFAAAVVCLFVASGTFHLFEHGTLAREVARRVDHAAIWILIAGSLTAIHALALREPWRRRVIAATWTVAGAGIVLKALFVNGLPGWMWLASYLGLGWMGTVVMFRIAHLHGWSRIKLLLLGGLVYSTGATLDSMGFPILVPDVIEAHEIFHLAVIGGVFIHWRYVKELATKPLAEDRPARRESTDQLPGTAAACVAGS